MCLTLFLLSSAVIDDKVAEVFSDETVFFVLLAAELVGAFVAFSCFVALLGFHVYLQVYKVVQFGRFSVYFIHV